MSEWHKVFLRYYLRHFKKPRLVVIESQIEPVSREIPAGSQILNYYYTLFKHDASVFERILNDPILAWPTKSSILASLLSSTVRYQRYISPLRVQSILKKKLRAHLGQSENKPESNDPGGDITDPIALEKAVDDHLASLKQEPWCSLSLKKEYDFSGLETFMSFAASHDLPVVIVEMPQHPKVYQTCEPAGFRARYLREIKRLAYQNRSFFIDLNEKKPATDGLIFKDAVHLNKSGESFYTMTLAQSISGLCRARLIPCNGKPEKKEKLVNAF